MLFSSFPEGTTKTNSEIWRTSNNYSTQSTKFVGHFRFSIKSESSLQSLPKKASGFGLFSPLCFIKMLNQVAVEAIYSATYLENYLDSVENLPNDLQRHISRMRQLDVDFQGRPAIVVSYLIVSISRSY